MTWLPINILLLMMQFFGPTPIVGTRATTQALMEQMSNGPRADAGKLPSSAR